MSRVSTLVVTLASSSLLMPCASSCAPPESPPSAPTGPVWGPGVMLPSTHEQHRGLVDVRGLIHAHSVYSHDACDGEPVVDGANDRVCMDDFRDGLCGSQHDFVMLTDHADRFAQTTYPDALLYEPTRGDVLVEREVDGSVLPVASRMACGEGRSTLVMAGSESGFMPVGLLHHATLHGEAAYGDANMTSEGAAALHDAGAVVLLAHPEDYSVEQLRALPLDGFEMFNLHRNTVVNAGVALDLIVRVNDGDPDLLHPDLVVAAIFSEDPDYLQRWGRVLAGGLKRTTTMGTDCHRNTFRKELQDGERVDSYRRMMNSFSNHLLIEPQADGSFDDVALKDALRAGRLYGAFEMLGHPQGFDYFATPGASSSSSSSSAPGEMGSEVPVGSILRAHLPTLRALDPAAPPPTMTLRLLRAIDDAAGWELVRETDDAELTFTTTTPGAYRVEVRMVPEHLRAAFAYDATTLLADGRDFVWIYSNAIYVR